MQAAWDRMMNVGVEGLLASRFRAICANMRAVDFHNVLQTRPLINPKVSLLAVRNISKNELEKFKGFRNTSVIKFKNQGVSFSFVS